MVLKQLGKPHLLKEVWTSQRLAQTLKDHLPELLIIDPIDSAEFSHEMILSIRDTYPDLPVLVISNPEKGTDVLQLVKSGIMGYLTWRCKAQEIIQALQMITSGQKFFCDQVLSVILSGPTHPTEEETSELSQREQEILSLIAKGMTNKQIASALFISHHTVHTHRKNMMKKLGIKSSPQLIVYAIQSGLVDAPDP
ncbi:response regulator transcription factor [Pontibacter sp. G13]|uniref:response regulator transcription factor n=1 Tax=Pontibacter sp. G13 TaxID=3074898 RepID=UPI00288A956E|nr:response regulator transcription factor [Pontibacter sp. G13]WNJ20547.1 response regulator transcription factor [Pontibacter sp. G13]